MKVRNGFVSNSSSSSFCIIGVEDDTTIQELLRADGVDWEGSGYGTIESNSGIQFYGGYDRPDWAGLDAQPLLEKHTLPEARAEFVKWAKKHLKVAVNPKQVNLYYGEAGEG